MQMSDSTRTFRDVKQPIGSLLDACVQGRCTIAKIGKSSLAACKSKSGAETVHVLNEWLADWDPAYHSRR